MQSLISYRRKKMDFEKISSRSNEKVKLFRHLSQSASFRRETGLFALEGARLCSDVAKTGIEIKTAFFTKKRSKSIRTISLPSPKRRSRRSRYRMSSPELSPIPARRRVFLHLRQAKRGGAGDDRPQGNIYSARQYAGSVESRRGAQNRRGVRHERRHSRRRMRYI